MGPTNAATVDTNMTSPSAETAREYQLAHTGAVCFDRSTCGKITVQGKDAATFLHNLSSNDIKGLQAGRGCEAFFLNVKAKVLAHAWIWRLPGDTPTFWIDPGPGQGTSLLTHLDRHLISEQVELVDRTTDQVQLHLTGPELEQRWRHLGGASLPAEGEVVLAHLADTPVQARGRSLFVGTGRGIDLLAPATAQSSVLELLTTAGIQPGGTHAWEILRIEAGIPFYSQDIDETTLAPEVGRTNQAISYQKGCYLGQEPVVRIRDLGHVNRTLMGLEIDGAEPVERGAKVLQGDLAIGSVTSAIGTSSGRVRALAYLQREHQEPGMSVTITTAGGVRSGSVSGLPFSS